MAWRSSGTCNASLIENLWRNKMIRDLRVKEAFLRVDRKYYAPREPYQDRPQSIGHSATISAPHMHALALEHLVDFLTTPQSGNGIVALDIGSGSGYLTHVMAELAVGPDAVVIGVDHIDALTKLGKDNMAKSESGRAMLESGRVRFRLGDGRKGWVEPGLSAASSSGNENENHGIYDAIHVGASARVIHPELISQLKSPGRMFIPVYDQDDTDGNQHIWQVDKDGKGEVTCKKLFGVRYVPLTDARE